MCDKCKAKNAVKSLDRATVRMIHEKIDRAVKALAGMYGLHVPDNKGSVCRYNSESMTIKYTFDIPVKGKGGIIIDRYGKDFQNLAEMYGMKADWLGQAFNDGKNVYTITGYNTKARKSPIMIQRIDGRKFKCPPSFVIRNMAKGSLGRVK